MAASTGNDTTQETYLAEEVILLDENDNVIGKESKKNSHLVENIDNGMLHRAFSVFLFNSKGELMLQQRAGAKITFPLRWTNTCCSHPLHVPEELEDKDQLGVKRAAIRKLEHELGIPASSFTPDDFVYLTRIHYKAHCHGPWAEHEIDYVLFVQNDVEVNLNLNEVEAIKYVDEPQLRQMFEDAKNGKIVLSPWFEMIANHVLFDFWPKLANIREEAAKYSGRDTIHRLKLEGQH